jgi:hypothetical protein
MSHDAVEHGRCPACGGVWLGQAGWQPGRASTPPTSWCIPPNPQPPSDHACPACGQAAAAAFPSSPHPPCWCVSRLFCTVPRAARMCWHGTESARAAVRCATHVGLVVQAPVVLCGAAAAAGGGDGVSARMWSMHTGSGMCLHVPCTRAVLRCSAHHAGCSPPCTAARTVNGLEPARVVVRVGHQVNLRSAQQQPRCVSMLVVGMPMCLHGTATCKF